jgi:enoyl-CoA hydratase/carnithine racemase
MTAMQLPFDFRFVWAGAKLTFPFVRRGIVPEGVSVISPYRRVSYIPSSYIATSSYLLPRLIGHSRANSLLLTGATYTADSPLVQDLYHKILPTREEVFPAALAFAKELAATTSQVSIAVTKGLLQHPGDSAEENHLLDSRAMRALGGTADGEEGIRSFKEKREPKFSGTLSKDLGPWYPWVSALPRF